MVVPCEFTMNPWPFKFLIQLKFMPPCVQCYNDKVYVRTLKSIRYFLCCRRPSKWVVPLPGDAIYSCSHSLPHTANCTTAFPFANTGYDHLVCLDSLYLNLIFSHLELTALQEIVPLYVFISASLECCTTVLWPVIALWEITFYLYVWETYLFNMSMIISLLCQRCHNGTQANIFIV